MEFISKSDFSTVGGQKKPDSEFDFENFNSSTAVQQSGLPAD
jgi:hypothetical protein